MKKFFIFVVPIIIIVGIGIWFFVFNEEKNKTVLPTPSSTSTLVATVNYICHDYKTITATFYKGETVTVSVGEPLVPTGSAKISLSDGRNFDLLQTISADGERYANTDESFVFWSKGNSAMVLENGAETNYTSCLVLADDPGGLSKTYLNNSVGFSLRYPVDYLVDDAYKYQALGPGKDIVGVKFTIPESLTTGTNLSSFDTGVSVETLRNVNNCQAGLFLGGETEVKKVTENGVEYSFTMTKGAGAGNFYEEEVWTISNTTSCLAIRYFIHSMNIGNYPEGAVTEFDREALISQFDKIRHSINIQESFYNGGSFSVLDDVWSVYANPLAGFQINYPNVWKNREYFSNKGNFSAVAFDPTVVATSEEYNTLDLAPGIVWIFVGGGQPDTEMETVEISPGLFAKTLKVRNEESGPNAWWYNKTDQRYYVDGVTIVFAYSNNLENNTAFQKQLSDILSSFKIISNN